MPQGALVLARAAPASARLLLGVERGRPDSCANPVHPEPPCPPSLSWASARGPLRSRSVTPPISPRDALAGLGKSCLQACQRQMAQHLSPSLAGLAGLRLRQAHGIPTRGRFSGEPAPRARGPPPPAAAPESPVRGPGGGGGAGDMSTENEAISTRLQQRLSPYPEGWDREGPGGPDAGALGTGTPQTRERAMPVPTGSCGSWTGLGMEAVLLSRGQCVPGEKGNDFPS